MGRLIDQSFTVHDFLSLDWPIFSNSHFQSKRCVHRICGGSDLGLAVSDRYGIGHCPYLRHSVAGREL
jgi:hypothetical protein